MSLGDLTLHIMAVGRGGSMGSTDSSLLDHAIFRDHACLETLPMTLHMYHIGSPICPIELEVSIGYSCIVHTGVTLRPIAPYLRTAWWRRRTQAYRMYQTPGGSPVNYRTP